MNILKYFVTFEDEVTLPGVVSMIEVDEDNLDALKTLSAEKNNRIAIIYRYKGEENYNIAPYCLYAKFIRTFEQNGKHYLVFRGIRKARAHSFCSSNKKSFEKQLELLSSSYTEEMKKELLESTAPSEREDYLLVVFSDEDENLNNSNYSELDYSNSSILSGTLAFEKMGESIFMKNPLTKKTFTYDEIIKLQAEDGLSEKNIKENKGMISLIFSFTKEKFGTFKKMDYFMSFDASSKINNIGNFLTSMAKNLELENEINEKINLSLSQHQKEYMLREKMKIIKGTLDEIDGTENFDKFSKDLEDKKLRKIYPESVIKIIKYEENRYSQMMPASPDANISKTYIETLKQLPWRRVEKDVLDINRARKVLDKYHYGLKEVKERIVEYLAVMINNRNNNPAKKGTMIDLDDNQQIDLNLFKEKNESNKKDENKTFNNVPILTLVGPPGTGKTSLAKAISEALVKKFVKISLGGVHDESEIRGHRRTYVGAMPGKIIKGISKSGVSNPLVLLDEIDKMASDMKGDPASAMLEVLDPEQNTNFQDHYLEHEYDLSKVIFIATANYYEDIPAPLLDRVEIIELSPYTINEKIQIAKNHLIPKVIEQASLNREQFIISDDELRYIIKHYTIEAGVRGLKRILDKLARKIVVKVLDDPKLTKFNITTKEITEMLGVIKFKDEEVETNEVAGIVNGLAYTSYGGSTLQIEVTTYPGKGEIKLTGQLKDVMQESAQIALTYVRANAEKFNINDFDFENNTIHIHVPEGAVPKDGPSAGVTFTTAIISALSKRSVPTDYGMTGEITLRGKVLEIGGLKEKSFAATQRKIKNIFIPDANVKNLQDIPDEIKSEINYIPVKNYEEIYEVIFMGKEPKIHKENSKNKN
ncbi:endopeptidase La [Mycoplasma anserisalpingitidis]|uniref:endopeptidase La n=1 Tax=Mycoplasma anserisalpingitidis TaxID=519450 RepID=UPI0011B1BAA5|nr:endopeptidase La [Mycoplasma anserisalpingitidis]QDY87385.1 endopeptidase La [Mycoplasma anserisalpingitidis]